jgi:hypothetical protein
MAQLDMLQRRLAQLNQAIKEEYDKQPKPQLEIPSLVP